MKRHIILILFLVVTVPVIALSWIGYRMLEDEQGLIRNQINKSLTDRLQNISGLIASEMDILQEELGSGLSFSPDNDMPAPAHPGLIEKTVVLDERGRRLYPYGPIPQYLAERVSVAVADIRMVQDNIQRLALQKYIRTRAGHMLSYDGWYVYSDNSSQSLLFWQEDPAGRILVALIDEKALIDYLAASISPAIEQPHETLILSGKDGQNPYQWGAGAGKAQAGRARVTIPLAFPLGHYTLSFYTNTGPDFSRSLQFQLFLQLGAVAFILLFLVIYIYDAMREANKKVSFVNQVSHELKTPLTNIRMYAELLEQSCPEEDGSAKKKLGIIQYECQRLSRLINNVLTLSHKNALKPKLENHDVDALIRHVIEGFGPVLQQNGIKAELDLDAGYFMIDRDGLEQALINLVSNVEKYAAAGGYLGIKSRQDKGRLYIRIRDKGPGIPQKMKERVFKPFFRMQNSVTEGVSGAGIGLALARDLVRKSGGDLRLAESRTGACFEVVI